MKGASIKKVTTVGIDLAKSVCQIHGVDNHGKAVLRKKLDRSKVLEYFLKLQPCLIGMEACGSAHYWARNLSAMGHVVKLMAPQFVKPYVKTNKNDAADAETICEAVTRPNMHFAPIKTDEQQAVLSLRRVRQSFVRVRTAQANQIRGLLSEFGEIIPQGIAHIAKRLPENLDLPSSFRELLQRLYDHLKELERQVDEMYTKIQQWHKASGSASIGGALLSPKGADQMEVFHRADVGMYQAKESGRNAVRIVDEHCAWGANERVGLDQKRVPDWACSAVEQAQRVMVA